MGYKRALVVDDSKVGRVTMQKKLEALGVMVDLVESAPDALDYLAQQRPDVIFMDHLMPEMDGFEATRRIKSAPATSDIPVFIISGSDDEAFVREARSIGAANAITKPPAAGVLEAIMGSLPETVAAPVPGEAAKAAPKPVAAEKHATPYMDQAAVHAIVEQVLGGVVEHLRGDLLAGVRKQVEAEFDNERKALREWNTRLEERLEQTTTAMTELRQGSLDADTLRQQLTAMEQRLLPLEASAGRAMPTFDEQLEKLEQHVAPRLAEIKETIGRHEPMLDGLRQELLARVDDQNVQAEQSVRDLIGRVERLSEDMKLLSGGTLASETKHDQRYSAIEQRLVAIESAEHTSGPDLETMLEAINERIAPQLAELRNELQDQPSVPLEEDLRERLAGQLQEQHETLRSELDAQRTQLQAMEHMRGALEAEMAALGERLQARIEDGREQLTTGYEQERVQLAAALAEQQTRLGVCDDDWTRRFEALEARLEEMARVGIDDRVQGVLEQRIAQMREVIGAALQPSYPGRAASAAEVEHDYDAQQATPVADKGNDGLRAGVVKLEGRLKTLTVMVAIGGAVLLAAIATIAYLR